MKTRVCAMSLFLGLWAVLDFAAAQDATKSALETDSTGWIDLFPGKNLKGWKRMPLAPDEKLDARNPWSADDKNKLLLCDGIKIKEMVLHDRPFKDGIFHVEWRFRKSEGKMPPYNSGIYVRSQNGTHWVQVQVAHVDKPPFLGDLFADVPANGKPKRIIISGQGDKRAKPPGEWNTYEITAKGKTITVWINGAVATTWNDCPFPSGHVGLQAEYFVIEFKNLKFKEL